MQIDKITVKNFRLLQNFEIDLERNLSLIIGKNNSGKTSLLILLDKFLKDKPKFSYNDFSNSFKKELKGILDTTIEKTEYKEKAIELFIEISYNEKDDLSKLSKLMMDLDPNNNKIILNFSYVLDYQFYLSFGKDYKAEKQNKENFIENNFSNYFQDRKRSLLDNPKSTDYIDLKKEKISLDNILSFRYINAKRNVTNKETDKALSSQIASVYKNEKKQRSMEELSSAIQKADEKITKSYETTFKEILDKIKKIGGRKPDDTSLKVISTLQEQDLLENNTTVTYKQGEYHLPESFNGLGYMNLISIIFDIDIKLHDFQKDNKPADINLLFIEEPEAHAHPQMQYIFIKNIKELLKVDFNLQTIVSTHSAHILSESDFKDLRYFKREENNIICKNITKLEEEYREEKRDFEFVKQYLTLNRAEIFFADKVIFIEGDTERILMPAMMKKNDIDESEGNKLLSQNISIIEVGAYAHKFEKFIDFLGIKTLIITDIDSVDNSGKSCEVSQGSKTSNATLKHFFSNKEKINDLIEVKNELKENKLFIAFQKEENGYHARSFEDAFIHINKDFVKNFKVSIKNTNEFEITKNTYDLANKCIKKKTHFSLEILYKSEQNFSNWEIPAYIKEGLKWLKENE